MLSLIWSPDKERWVALVAGVAMAINVPIAATLGTLLPMGLKQLKLDPALMSGPPIATLLDTIGFLSFLTLVSVSMKFFMPH